MRGRRSFLCCLVILVTFILCAVIIAKEVALVKYLELGLIDSDNFIKSNVIYLFLMILMLGLCFALDKIERLENILIDKSLISKKDVDIKRNSYEQEFNLDNKNDEVKSNKLNVNNTNNECKTKKELEHKTKLNSKKNKK